MDDFPVRHTHCLVDYFEELVPGEIVITYGICVGALVKLGGANYAFGDLADGEHRRAALRIHCYLAHVGKLFDKDDPNRAPAGLNAENIRQLQNRDAHIIVRKRQRHLLLLDSASDIRMLFAKLHIRVFLCEICKV